MNQNIKYGLRYGVMAAVLCVGTFLTLYAASYAVAEFEYKKDIQETDNKITAQDTAQMVINNAKTYGM